MNRFALCAVIALLASGCASGSGGARIAPVQPAARTVASPPATPAIGPQSASGAPQRGSGPGALLGLTAGELTARLGSPRLTLVEGDAHKLQFADGACVLDVFLYPAGSGSPEQATHIATRRRSDGAAVDEADCIAAIAGAAAAGGG